MSWLEELLAGRSGGTFPMLPQEDPALQAEQARQAAALAAMARSGVSRRPPPVPELPQTAVPFSAGMLLSPYGVSWPVGSGQEPPAGVAAAVGGSAPLSDQSVPRDPAADLPPSTNDPLSSEPILFRDGVPLPRPRPPGIGGDTETAPMSLAPGQPPDAAMASAVPAPAPRALPPGTTPNVSRETSAPGATPSLGGILGNIFNPANAPLLLALGGGMAGAPSFGQGLSRAGTAAAPYAALLRKEQQTEGGIAESYRALVARGVTPQEALAAVRNPDIMKAVVAKYFETKPLSVHNVTDALNNQTPVVFNPTTGRFSDMQGRQIGGDGTSGGVSAPGGTAGLLAPGVSRLDDTLTGDAYLNQYSPDVRAAVRAYINGDVLPTGNPRQRTLSTIAKQIAQRYGQDTGTPVSDTIYAERRQYRQQLGSNSATAAGGQAKAFNQGIEHAHSLAQTLERLGNYDPVGVPSIAHGINTFRQAVSTSQTDLVRKAQALGQTLAGEVGKLFSGTAGGGVDERRATRERFNTVDSPRELAGALEGTLETMEGGLRALEQRRDQVLGPNSGVNFVNAETRQKIAEIREIIDRLRGTSASHAPASAPAPAPLDPGASVVINGVTIRRRD